MIMAFDFSNIKNTSKGKLDGLFSAPVIPEGARIEEIDLYLIDSFKDHPFSVNDDIDMEQLVESVKENGILCPAIVRAKDDGRYELIAGHRRKRACELAGLSTLKAEIRDLSDEDATVLMVDTNLQREKILPSERARAYAMKLEALRIRNAKEGIAGKTLNAAEKEMGIGHDTIRRYMRLNFLIDGMKDLVDNDKLPMKSAIALSYLPYSKQEIIQPYCDKFAPVSAKIANEVKEWLELNGDTDEDTLTSLFLGEIKPKKKKGSRPSAPTAIKFKQIKSYIPNTILKEDYEDYVIRALMFYQENAPKGE